MILPKKKLDKQICEHRIKQHKKYEEEKEKKKTEQCDVNFSCNDDDSSDSTVSSHKWPKRTVLIVGDSIISGVDERRISHRNNTKVRVFPGATVDDMFDYIKPLLLKAPDTIIVHVGTNNCVNETSRSILDKILRLKTFI